jgi:flagellar FliL protein
MAETAQAVNASLDGDDGETEEKKGGNKMLLIIIGAVLLLGGGGAAAYFTGFIGGAETEDSQEKDDSEGVEQLQASFLEIPDMIVNLSSADGQPRYLRLSVQLELKTEEDRAAVELVMPRVVDQFQTYLRELRVKDLRGSAGIYRLQMELLSRVNAAAYPIEVQDVLFQEILIQ